MFEKLDRLQARINQYRPYEGSMLEQIKNYYRIGLTYSSNALEGSSLTESETRVVLEDGLTAGGKPLRDYLEAIGHGQAYDYMFELMAGSAYSTDCIRSIHQLFYRKIDPEKAGVYRQEQVIITGSHYPVANPESIAKQMDDFVAWLNRHEKSGHPVELAARAHLRFVFIHPFIDGNGRVARLLMNLCLLRGGYSIAIIPPVLRSEYITLLESAHVNELPFIRFIAEREEETQKDLLRLLMGV